VGDVEVCFSHSLKYFENNFTVKQLKVPAYTMLRSSPSRGQMIKAKAVAEAKALRLRPRARPNYVMQWLVIRSAFDRQNVSVLLTKT